MMIEKLCAQSIFTVLLLFDRLTRISHRLSRKIDRQGVRFVCLELFSAAGLHFPGDKVGAKAALQNTVGQSRSPVQ